MKSILFVCTANRYRSPFAEAVFKSLLENDGKVKDWQVSSAGTWTKVDLQAMPEVILKAKEFALDLKQHRSVEVDREMLAKNDLVIVMEKGHKEALWAEFADMRERVFLLSEIVDNIVYDIPDPARAMEDADGIINELYALLQRGYDSICSVAEKLHKAQVF